MRRALLILALSCFPLRAQEPPDASVPCSCTGSKGSITSYEVESESACRGMVPLLNESAIRDRLIAGGETWVCNIATSDPPEPSEVSSDVLQMQALLAEQLDPQTHLLSSLLGTLIQQDRLLKMQEADLKAMAQELAALREQVGKMKGCKP